VAAGDRDYFKFSDEERRVFYGTSSKPTGRGTGRSSPGRTLLAIAVSLALSFAFAKLHLGRFLLHLP
jgi:hypothetical protein